MTDLNKPVSRRSRQPFAHYGRRIVVTLEPDDIIAMRLERSRTLYKASIESVFRQLAMWYAHAEAKLRGEGTEERRNP